MDSTRRRKSDGFKEQFLLEILVKTNKKNVKLYTVIKINKRRSSQLFSQLLRKESLKKSSLAEILTLTSAIPVQCSNQLS